MSREQELAWIEVYETCLKLGMKNDKNQSGVKNVISFIATIYTKQKLTPMIAYITGVVSFLFGFAVGIVTITYWIK